MKSKIFIALAFALAIAGAFAFKSDGRNAVVNPSGAKAIMFVQYKNAFGVCQPHTNCSNVNINNLLCVGVIGTYYVDNTNCVMMSNFKWRP